MRDKDFGMTHQTTETGTTPTPETPALSVEQDKIAQTAGVIADTLRLKPTQVPGLILLLAQLVDAALASQREEIERLTKELAQEISFRPCGANHEAESRLAEQTATVERLKALKPYIRELRLDASGEQGRMPAGRMYRLADELDALTERTEP